MKVPFKIVHLDQTDIKEIVKVLKSGQIGLGNEVYKFQVLLAEYTGFKYAVAVDSCTSALFLCAKYFIKNTSILDMPSIPSMTVPLVADALFEADIAFKFDDRCEWVGMAYNILGTNIWDSTHELERGFRSKFPKDAAVCISFYPTKNIGSADGGAILTDDKAFADWVRKISTYGRDQGTTYKNSWEYDVVMKGYKRHYTNLQAAICSTQLMRLDETNTRRRHVVESYNRAFGLKNDSLYLYRIKVQERDGFIAKMTQKHIECGVHFKPLHLMTAFADIQFIGDKNKVDEFYAHTVSLPFFDTMSEKQIEWVINHVKPYVQK